MDFPRNEEILGNRYNRLQRKYYHRIIVHSWIKEKYIPSDRDVVSKSSVHLNEITLAAIRKFIINPLFVIVQGVGSIGIANGVTPTVTPLFQICSNDLFF